MVDKNIVTDIGNGGETHQHIPSKGAHEGT